MASWLHLQMDFVDNGIDASELSLLWSAVQTQRTAIYAGEDLSKLSELLYSLADGNAESCVCEDSLGLEGLEGGELDVCMGSDCIGVMFDDHSICYSFI